MSQHIYQLEYIKNQEEDKRLDQLGLWK